MGAVQRDRVADRLNAGCSAGTRRSAPSLALIFFGHVDVDARYRPVGAPLSFLTLLPSSALPIFHILNSHRALSVLRGHKDWTRNRFLSFTCVVSGICHGCSRIRRHITPRSGAAHAPNGLFPKVIACRVLPIDSDGSPISWPLTTCQDRPWRRRRPCPGRRAPSRRSGASGAALRSTAQGWPAD